MTNAFFECNVCIHLAQHYEQFLQTIQTRARALWCAISDDVYVSKQEGLAVFEKLLLATTSTTNVSPIFSSKLLWSEAVEPHSSKNTLTDRARSRSRRKAPELNMCLNGSVPLEHTIIVSKKRIQALRGNDKHPFLLLLLLLLMNQKNGLQALLVQKTR